MKSTVCKILFIFVVFVSFAGELPTRPKGTTSHAKSKAQLAITATCNNTIQTTPVDAITPDALVSAILGPGVSFFNVTYTGITNSAGVFADTAAVFGITNGIVLSSGSIENIKGPNLADDITQDNALPGDADLDTLSVPYPSLDATVLEFDFVPTLDNVTFEYVFTSDEYNEWANSDFNDVFGFWVNGTNVAVLPVSATGTNVVSVDNINGGNPIGTNPQNPQFYINNDIASGAPFCTEMDGRVVLLTATSAVHANQTNHIKLAIADASDRVLDSNVIIKGGSFSANHAPNAVCKNITLMGDADCHVIVRAKDIDDGSGDTEDDDTVQLAVSPTELWGEGIHPVTLSVTDTNGAIGYCLATVKVVCYRIGDVAVENDDVRVSWTCIAGKTNALQAANIPGNFVDISPAIIISGANRTNILDVGAATNFPGRHYRIRLVP